MWHFHPTMDMSNPMRAERGFQRQGRFPKFEQGKQKQNAVLLLQWFWDWLK